MTSHCAERPTHARMPPPKQYVRHRRARAKTAARAMKCQTCGVQSRRGRRSEAADRHNRKRGDTSTRCNTVRRENIRIVSRSQGVAQNKRARSRTPRARVPDGHSQCLGAPRNSKGRSEKRVAGSQRCHTGRNCSATHSCTKPATKPVCYAARFCSLGAGNGVTSASSRLRRASRRSTSR